VPVVIVPVVIVPVVSPAAPAIMFKTFAIPAIMIFIPTVVMGEIAALALPVALKKALAVVARTHPNRSGIWRTRPVSFMPSIVAADRIPISRDPDKIRIRLGWHDGYYSRRRRSADLDANGNIRRQRAAGQDNESKQCPFHNGWESTFSAKSCDAGPLFPQA